MWKKALDLFDEMEENGIEPSEVTYSVIISALGNGLQWERALRLLNLVSLKDRVLNSPRFNV
jgi:pentatricopeptide repeat protein